MSCQGRRRDFNSNYFQRLIPCENPLLIAILQWGKLWREMSLGLEEVLKKNLDNQMTHYVIYLHSPIFLVQTLTLQVAPKLTFLSANKPNTAIVLSFLFGQCYQTCHGLSAHPDNFCCGKFVSWFFFYSCEVRVQWITAYESKLAYHLFLCGLWPKNLPLFHLQI